MMPAARISSYPASSRFAPRPCGDLRPWLQALILKKFSYLPHWSPQAQFAGYYMALQKGVYRRHGIDLTILQGGPPVPPWNTCGTKQADVATLWLSSALQLVDQGVEMVNVGQVIQRSALVLVTKKSSGIETPQQMNGKKIALWPADFQIQPDAFFEKFHLKTG